MEANSLFILLIVLHGLTLVLLLFLASRGTGLLLELFESLDNKIAEAITKLINEGSIDIEPANPIQAFVAQMMQQKMSEMQPRGDGGQFVEIKAKD